MMLHGYIGILKNSRNPTLTRVTAISGAKARSSRACTPPATVGDLQLGAAGTAQHMSTQRRGAALFDGRHDLQLSKAQRYSLSPRWPVDAEDVRDLQHGALRAVLA